MRGTAQDAGILVFGPRADAEGGIAAVLRNYSKMRFWSVFHCQHLPTMRDFRYPVPKLIYELYRLAASLVILAVGPRPCAVSIHTAQDSSFYRKLIYLLLARMFRVPAVLHIHPASFVEFYRDGRTLRRCAVRLASRLSDQIVFLAEQTRDALSDAFPLSKSRVLPNPVDVSEFADQPDQTNRSVDHILFLGWIIREKGVYDLVDAMPEVLREYPHAKFTFAGNKEIEKLRTLLACRGHSGSAEIPGWVDTERRLALLKTATMLVLPSYSEGFPNVILEAMASGLPIVTTPVGAIPSVLESGATALFVSPGTPSGIASAILTLLRNAKARRRIADLALQRVRTHYSLEAVSEELTTIYSRYYRPTVSTERPH